MKKYITILTALITISAFADNDVHTGELSGSYIGTSHVNSVWENTYVKEGETVWFSEYYDSTNYSGANFKNADLTSAHFDEAELGGADFTNANLTSVSFWVANVSDVNFTNANLTSARFAGANIYDANFTNAIIKGADFYGGLAEEQLKSTKSYQDKDLTGVRFDGGYFSGWDFSGQNLTSVSFGSGYGSSTLIDTIFTNAIVKDAHFYNTVSKGFTEAQLKSTKSYQDKDLTGINLGKNDLTGWNFESQNLSNSNFSNSKFTDAILANSNVSEVDLSDASIGGANLSNIKGFTAEQLYSTASYKNKDLEKINFSGNDLSGWSFASQNLSDSDFSNATLTSTTFINAKTTNANFSNTISKGLTRAQLEAASNGLTNINLSNNDFASAGWTFANADLTNTKLENATLTGVDFSNATLTGTSFANAKTTNANFSNTISKGLTRAQLEAASNGLTNINLSNNDFASAGWTFANADLTNTKLENATLTGVDFSNATLTGTSFANAIVKGAGFSYTVSKGFTEEQLMSTKSYKDKNLDGILLGNNDLSDWNFNGLSLISSHFASSVLDNANFFNADLSSSNMNFSSFVKTDFRNCNLTSAEFFRATINGADFTNADLTSVSFEKAVVLNANFTNATLSGVTFTSESDLTGSIIMGADLTSTVQNGFTFKHLASTKSYADKNLSGVIFDYNDIGGWILSGLNLQNTSFFASKIAGTNFSNADLRGADTSVTKGTATYKNTIMSDGAIKSFSMASADDSFSIRKYTPATSGGAVISAKISESDATISGGAKLTLEQGATFEITNGKTLTVAADGSIQTDTDLLGSTVFNIDGNAGLTFEDGAILTVNIVDSIVAGEAYTFTVISFDGDSVLAGLSDLVKGKTLLLTVLGEKFGGAWDYTIDGKSLSLSISSIPEPAEYAAIFGSLAIAFAFMRRRRQ